MPDCIKTPTNIVCVACAGARHARRVLGVLQSELIMALRFEFIARSIYSCTCAHVADQAVYSDNDERDDGQQASKTNTRYEIDDVGRMSRFSLKKYNSEPPLKQHPPNV